MEHNFHSSELICKQCTFYCWHAIVSTNMIDPKLKWLLTIEWAAILIRGAYLDLQTLHWYTPRVSPKLGYEWIKNQLKSSHSYCHHHHHHANDASSVQQGYVARALIFMQIYSDHFIDETFGCFIFCKHSNVHYIVYIYIYIYKRH